LLASRISADPQDSMPNYAKLESLNLKYCGDEKLENTLGENFLNMMQQHMDTYNKMKVKAKREAKERKQGGAQAVHADDDDEGGEKPEQKKRKTTR
jgi:hypothetical protein